MSSDLPKIGSYEYNERLYEVEKEHWWSMGMRAVGAGILDLEYKNKHDLHILDAGCGTGIMLKWLERYSQPRKVTGIDISWHALKFCKRRGNLPISQSSALELPFKDRVFDLIVCNDVIQHLPGGDSETISLAEFYRVLKPGKCLFIRTNSNQGMDEKDLPSDESYRRYNVGELRKKIEERGFNVLKITHANTLMSIIPTVKRLLKRAKQAQHHDHGLGIRLLPSSLRWLNGLLYLMMRGEAWLLSKPSITSPFGHTIFLLAQKPTSVTQ